MELMGNSTETIKGKIQSVGMGIQTYIGNKWDSIKGKVSSFGGFIQSNLSSALSTVRSKIQSLGSAFSGLGGIMSSVMGGIGLKSLSDMTIGAAVSRDRIFNLSYAILGAGQSMDTFKNSSSSLWNQMDADTNKSLVGLDQISQAMSVINMSANASESQLKALEPVILDIGQRAILMGKDGNEAVSLMQAAGKGLNGEFEMLRENFGITREKLEAAGWSGAADDIDGYTKALGDCLKQSGDVSDMMNTTSGKLTVLKKYWGLAGRSIGDEFLPYLDKALTGLVSFLDADQDGALDARGKKWLQYGYGVMAVASGFATIAPSIAPALSVLGSLSGATKSVLVFLGLMKGAEDALTISTLSNTIAEKANAIAKAAGGAAAVTATGANAGLTASLWAMTTALLANPITWVVLALIALAVAAYEVGKAFGWWSDIPSMLSAVWDGINRLWNAFINHPDVQAAISIISNALSTLWGWIVQAGHAILEFFGVSAGSEWDIVHSLIEGIGLAWQELTFPIRTIISLIQMAMGAFGSFYNGTLMPLGEYIMGILNPVFETLGTIWTGVIEQISGVVSVFQAFQAGQVDLVTVITTVATTLWNVWLLIVANLSNLVLTLASNLLTWATQAGLNFLTGIVLYLSQVPGRVWNYLVQTTTRILTAGAQWVSRARSAASRVVSGVVSFMASLPGRVASAIAGVVTAIISAGAQWVSNARQKASEVVSGARDALSGMAGAVSGALSGVVDAIVSPFREAYNTAKGIWDSIANLASSVPQVNSPAGGDFEWSYYGDSDVMASGGETTSSNLDINHKITLDLENVPSQIDTPTLINALQDKKVLKALTSNPDFQSLDANVKNKLNLKVNRARGI